MRVRVPPPAQSYCHRLANVAQARPVKSSWSKGLTAATDERVARLAASKRGRPNWSRGLSAKTDPRIARQAAARRGKKRGPYRTYQGQPRVIPISGRDLLREEQHSAYAYLLGLYLGDGYVVLSTNRLRSVWIQSTQR